MPRGKSKEELAEMSKNTRFTSETAAAAQAKSVASRNLHTMMVDAYTREAMKKAKGSTLTKMDKAVQQVMNGAAEGDIQALKLMTSVALSTQPKETTIETTDKGFKITTVGLTPGELSEL